MSQPKETRPCDVQGCHQRAWWRPRVRFGAYIGVQRIIVCDECKPNIRAILQARWKELAIRYNTTYMIDFISLDSIEEEHFCIGNAISISL